jgi:alpha-D-xyloside xylohydrolase
MPQTFLWRAFPLTLLLLGSTAWAAPMPVRAVQKQSNGVTLLMPRGALRLQVCTPRIFHVTYSPTGVFPADRVPVVNAHFAPAAFQFTPSAKSLTLATSLMQAQVDRRTGAVRFLDVSGKAFLSETPSGRNLTPITLDGPTPEAAYKSSQSFILPKDEGIYGLGQHQDGLLDYRGSMVTLEQVNREVAIPFLVSSRGYGLLWNNPAHTEVAVGATVGIPIPAARLFAADGKPGGLTAEYFNGQDLKNAVAARIDPQVDFDWKAAPIAGLGQENFSVRWTGFVQAEGGGEYTFTTTSDDGARLWIDGKQVIDDWNIHAARVDRAMVRLAPHSRHSVRMEYFQGTRDAVARLGWRPPGHSETLTWASEAAETIDYYVFYGPKIDTVEAAYRQATGKAPLPPKWALGYWQSKERYATQQEWLDIASEYRRRGLPIDNLVQDWFYWDPFPWGSHQFDPKRYPDPAAGIAELHDKYHLHLMISVWGKFDPGSPSNPDANFDTMNAHGYLYPSLGEPAHYYDSFNPEARRLYWQLMRDQIYSKGVDAWWLDASEPELDMRGFRRVPTKAGLGARVLNAWPLMHTTAVSQGQRATAPNKRVFILTRSAYAGQQRTGAATWSGDITASWDVLARQIPAGLNFCLSGIPYWTTDIGAFFVNYPGGADNPEYRELYTRWFEYGAFCPLFRSHGTSTPREMWRFGPQTQQTLLKYDNLRYRLMPYIYSQSWQVTHQGATLMRALVFDFPNDLTARESKDEFLFGPSLLVCPVIQSNVVTRRVYLPKGTSWIDFWTGQPYSGGETITASAPIDQLPLYVKAGGIIPMGPFLQYTSEKPADPIELRIYGGANGAFTLYEDEGDNTNYERGQYATIPLTWNEKTHALTLGARSGHFPGMPIKRTFHIVWVRSDHGTGVAPASTSDRTVTYDGQAVTVK